MLIKSAGLHIELEKKDYFVCSTEKKNINIILTSSNRKPLKLENINRKQVYSLMTQLQRILTGMQQEEAEVIVKNYETSLKNGVAEIECVAELYKGFKSFDA